MPENAKKTMTDTEIHQMATADWYSLIESLWIAIGKPVDKRRLLLYGEDLGNVPYGLLERAIKRIRRSQTYTIVPTLGELWNAINTELVADNCSTPEEWVDTRWNRFMRKITYAEVEQ